MERSTGTALGVLPPAPPLGIGVGVRSILEIIAAFLCETRRQFWPRDFSLNRSPALLYGVYAFLEHVIFILVHMMYTYHTSRTYAYLRVEQVAARESLGAPVHGVHVQACL